VTLWCAEAQHGLLTTEILLAAGVQVKESLQLPDAPQELRHRRPLFYAQDPQLISDRAQTTGQRYSLRSEPGTREAVEACFAEMWDRPSNVVPALVR